MAFNLLDTIKGYITPDLINTAAGHLGESSTGITKAVTGAVPVLLTGVINKAETGDAANLLSEAKKTASSGLLSRIGSVFSGGSSNILSEGTSWLNTLFGNKTSMITNSLANFAGIRNGSVSSLLSMLAPLSLGVIGKHAIDNNLSTSSFTQFLSGQKNSVMNALPSGLNLDSIFSGFQTSTPDVERIRPEMERTRDTELASPRQRRSPVLPILLILGALALFLLFLSRRGSKENTVANTDIRDTLNAVAPPRAAMASTPTHESMKVKLANNTEIEAYKGGIEDKMVTCLNDPNCKPGKDQWFDFDNINFETGSAKLTPESEPQIRNIVMILKAYPKTRIKIGGYTDRTGNAAANKKLSQERAQTVETALKHDGAQSAQIVGAEGYGSEYAKVAATASDEDRKVDRRIAVQLREK